MATERLSKPLEDEIERLWDEWGSNAPYGLRAAAKHKRRYFVAMRKFARMAEKAGQPEIECAGCGARDFDLMCAECGGTAIKEL
jgi:hypothetical protein